MKCSFYGYDGGVGFSCASKAPPGQISLRLSFNDYTVFNFNLVTAYYIRDRGLIESTFLSRIHFYNDFVNICLFCAFLNLVANERTANRTCDRRQIAPCAFANLMAQHSSNNAPGNHTQARSLAFNINLVDG